MLAALRILNVVRFERGQTSARLRIVLHGHSCCSSGSSRSISRYVNCKYREVNMHMGLFGGCGVVQVRVCRIICT